MKSSYCCSVPELSMWTSNLSKNSSGSIKITRHTIWVCMEFSLGKYEEMAQFFGDIYLLCYSVATFLDGFLLCDQLVLGREKLICEVVAMESVPCHG